MVTALLPYFGSNRMNAKFVAGIFEREKWIGIPFCGGLSEVYHMRNARTIVCNDSNRLLINLCEILQGKDGVRLRRELGRLPFHPDTISWAKEKLLFGPHRGYDAAKAYFIVGWMTRSGACGTNRELKSTQSVRWEAAGGDSVVRFQSAVSALREWHNIMRRVTFVCMDALEFLSKCHDDESCGIYCDPPFPGVGDNYKHSVNHEILETTLRGFDHCRILVRYYNDDAIAKIYKAWNRIDISGRNQTNLEREEWYFCNFTKS